MKNLVQHGRNSVNATAKFRLSKNMRVRSYDDLMCTESVGCSNHEATCAQPDPGCIVYNMGSRDFLTSMQQLLRIHFAEGYPYINLAARLAGCSVRTLQRRLKQHDLSYSILVRQAQIEYAKELLADKKLRTIDIALAVGYQDPSNFSRAFRRETGLSPTQYRSQNYVK